MSRQVEIVEVAPRDGLQSDPSMLSTDDKVELIGRAARAGIRRIEAVSFVNPKRVPQMADADAVMARVPRDLGASYIGLVLNRRGLERAVETGVDEINVVVVCTDTFAMKNQGQDTAGLIADALEICAGAAAVGMPASVTLAASFGCPFEGEVSLDRFASVVDRVATGLGSTSAPREIALADSIGVATPLDVRQRLALAAEICGPAGIALRCHFHNTRNTGLANAVAAVEAGVRVLDSSLGGIGGCPFAPGATGNIATEDLVYLLHRMGFGTGIDLDALCAEVGWVESALGHGVPGALSKAGNFPLVNT